MNAVETNVLIYVNDSRDRNKQAIAASLLAGLTEGVLIWQVACEYLAARRLPGYLRQLLVLVLVDCDSKRGTFSHFSGKSGSSGDS